MRGWCIAEDAFEASKARHKETLYTLGNGYLGVRGAPEEGHPVATTATFIAGVFDAAAGAVPELVVAPNWLGMRIFIGGEEFSMEAGEILDFRRALDMRDGVLERTVRWKDACGRVTRFTWRRIVSMADIHAAAISLSIVAENHDSEIVVNA
ncbi:MAG: glycoside hydrolase family 65 protein, partial [Bacillota bacterium]